MDFNLRIFSKRNACLTRNRSGDRPGHCNTFHFFALFKSWFAFKVCKILLSICPVKHRPLGWVWADNIALCRILPVAFITSHVSKYKGTSFTGIHKHPHHKEVWFWSKGVLSLLHTFPIILAQVDFCHLSITFCMGTWLVFFKVFF